MFPDRIRQTAEDEDATERLARLVSVDLKVAADDGRRKRLWALARVIPQSMTDRYIEWLASDESDWNNPPADIRRIADAMRHEKTW